MLVGVISWVSSQEELVEFYKSCSIGKFYPLAVSSDPNLSTLQGHAEPCIQDLDFLFKFTPVPLIIPEKEDQGKGSFDRVYVVPFDFQPMLLRHIIEQSGGYVIMNAPHQKNINRNHFSRLYVPYTVNTCSPEPYYFGGENFITLVQKLKRWAVLEQLRQEESNDNSEVKLAPLLSYYFNMQVRPDAILGAVTQ